MTKTTYDMMKDLYDLVSPYYKKDALHFDIDFDSAYDVDMDELKSKLVDLGYDPISIENEIDTDYVYDLYSNFEDNEVAYIREYFKDRVAYDSPKWLKTQWEERNPGVPMDDKTKRDIKDAQQIEDAFATIKEVYVYDQEVKMTLNTSFDFNDSPYDYGQEEWTEEFSDIAPEQIQKEMEDFYLLIRMANDFLKHVGKGFDINYVVEEIENNDFLSKKDRLTKENISQVLQDFEIGYESNHTFETYYGEELKTLGLSDEELVVLYTENSDKLNPDFVVSILEDVGSKSMFLKTQYTPLELFKKQVLKKQNRTKTPLQIDLELINKVLLEQGVHKTLVENIETFTKPENKPLLIELIKQNPDMIDFVDVSAISAISLKELNKLDNVIYDIMDSRTKSGQEKSDLLYRMSDSLNPQKLFNILEAKLQTQTVFFDEDENQEREINELEKDFKTYRGNNSRVYGERLVSGMKRSELLKNQKMIDLINKLWYVYDNSGIGYHRGNLLNLASDGVLKEIVNKPHQFSFYSIGNGENFVNDKIKPILENKNVSKETLTDLVSAIKVASKQFAPVDRGVASSYAPKIDKMIKNQIHKMDEIMANNKRP